MGIGRNKMPAVLEQGDAGPQDRLFRSAEHPHELARSGIEEADRAIATTGENRLTSQNELSGVGVTHLLSDLETHCFGVQVPDPDFPIDFGSGQKLAPVL